MGKRECELTLLCRVAQKRKEEMAKESPGISAREKIETDDILGMEYVVISLREGGEVKGYEFIENGQTFLTKEKEVIYVDILKGRLYLGIAIPERLSDFLMVLRSLFRDNNVMNPAFFLYDEEGNVKNG